MGRKLFLSFLALCLVVGVSLAWRLRPVMTEKECYNHFFPKKRFLTKIHSPVPAWMEKQIDADFAEVAPITSPALEKAYDVILGRLKEPIFLYHYRILDNRLYRYVPPGAHFSCRDSYFEKALKTLLSHTRLPDLDFILCPMDGIPEAIVPPDFYLMPDARDQVPILGQAKLKEPLTRHIILVPDQLSLADDWYNMAAEITALNDKISWESKIGKAFWRGRISDDVGPGSRLAHAIRFTPRLTLCRMARHYPDLINAASDYWPHLAELVQKEALARYSQMASKEDHLHYKYQLVLDGNICTYPGYQWRLLSDALTLKQESNQVQWFYGALTPYVHYLPIANNMSDLPEKVRWAEAHPAEVRAMIASARDFASNNLLYEDVYRYFYLVLNRYARHQQIDFQKLKSETKKDPSWINIHYRKRLALYKTLHRLFEK